MVNVGDTVEVFDYYNKGESELGIIIDNHNGVVQVEMDDGHVTYLNLQFINKMWKVTNFANVFEQMYVNAGYYEQESLYIVPNVLKKPDYQKLLDAAIDRKDWDECTRIYNKMEVMA